MSFVTFILKHLNNESSFQKATLKQLDRNASRSQCIQDYVVIIHQLFDMWRLDKGIMVDRTTLFSFLILPEHDCPAIYFKDFRKRESILRLATELVNLDDEMNVLVSIALSDAAADSEDRCVPPPLARFML